MYVHTTTSTPSHRVCVIYTCMFKAEAREGHPGVLFYHCPLFLFSGDEVSFWVWSYIGSQRALVRTSLGPLSEPTSVLGHAWLFMWVLGIHSQVSRLALQALIYPELSPHLCLILTVAHPTRQHCRWNPGLSHAGQVSCSLFN